MSCFISEILPLAHCSESFGGTKSLVLSSFQSSPGGATFRTRATIMRGPWKYCNSSSCTPRVSVAEELEAVAGGIPSLSITSLLSIFSLPPSSETRLNRHLPGFSIHSFAVYWIANHSKRSVTLGKPLSNFWGHTFKTLV